MTPAVRALEAAGVAFEVLEYAHDPSEGRYGEEAARALGISTKLVFKTLVVGAPGPRPALRVAIVPVAASLDLRAAARLAGVKKLELADAASAQRATGYVLGGISPFGQKQRLAMLLDESAQAHERVHVSGGRRGLQLAVAPADLMRLTNARVGPIAVWPDERADRGGP